MTTTPQVRFRSVDGVRIRYADSGGSNEPVVLLTSPWPESVYAFTAMWATLAGKARLFAVDLPGFGASERRDDLLSPRAMGGFLARLVAEADLGTPHIVAPDVGTSAALFAEGAIVGALTVGGIAWADIPDSGRIQGCYLKGNGQLRVIDTDKGGNCLPTETALPWNQRGPTGPTGQDGAPATVLWANVYDDGTLAQGSHVVSTTKENGDLYDVTFDQNVSACAVEVTQRPSNGKYIDAQMLYEATTGVIGSGEADPDTVVVRVRTDGGGTPQFFGDDFSIAVFC
jgi:pimeloyl-ACP methyl ester carboxylesterase